MKHQVHEQSEIRKSKLGMGNFPDVINLTSATFTVLAEMSGAIFVLDRAAGVTVTLPAATGSGRKFEFFIKTTITSNNYVFNRAGSDTICGISVDDDGDGEPANGWAATAATAVTLGGTSNATGGTKGGKVVFTDIASGLWHCLHHDAQSGTEATPFS